MFLNPSITSLPFQKMERFYTKGFCRNPPPAQTIPPSLPPIGNLSTISKSVNPQTENILTAQNLLEQNNPPVVMDIPHPCTLRGKKSPELIITDNNVQPKLKTQAGFVRKIVVLCPFLYLYRDEVRRYDLIE